jgi:DivIVA domain-containing protein
LFWFMLIALVAVVAAVALAVLGNGGALPEAEPDRLTDPLPADRPVHPGDLDALRIPVTLRGYRMADVDDLLDRLGAELAERDTRIAELQAVLTGGPDTAAGGRPIGRQPYGPGYDPQYAPDQAADYRPEPPRPEYRPAPPQPGYRPEPGPDFGPNQDPGYGAPAYPGRPPYGQRTRGGSGLPQGPTPAQRDPHDDHFDPWGTSGE